MSRPSPLSSQPTALPWGGIVKTLGLAIFLIRQFIRIFDIPLNECGMYFYNSRFVGITDVFYGRNCNLLSNNIANFTLLKTQLDRGGVEANISKRSLRQ